MISDCFTAKRPAVASSYFFAASMLLASSEAPIRAFSQVCVFLIIYSEQDSFCSTISIRVPLELLKVLPMVSFSIAWFGYG